MLVTQQQYVYDERSLLTLADGRRTSRECLLYGGSLAGPMVALEVEHTVEMELQAERRLL